MKKNDYLALLELDIKELNEKLLQLEQSLNLARLEVRVGKRKNTHTRLIADQVARLKTLIGQKKRQQALKPTLLNGDKI